MFNSSFKIRIRIGFIAVFTIMLLVVLYLFVQINRISGESKLLYEHPYQVSNTIRDLKIELYQVLRMKRDVQYTDNKHQLDSLQNRVAICNNSIINDFNIIHSKYLGNIKDVDSAFTAYKVWKIITDKFFELKTENKTENIRFLIKTEARFNFNTILIHLDLISDFANDKAESVNNKINTTETNAKLITIILLLLSFLTVIFIIFYLSNSISRPINIFISEANILLKKNEKAKIKNANEEDILLATIAELKTSYQKIESQGNELNNYNKQLEEKVNQRTAELTLANKELSLLDEEIKIIATIVETSEDAILSKSIDGTIISWNHTAEKMFGYTAKEVLGENISLIISPEYISEEKSIVDKLCNDEIIQHYETVRTKKSGEQFPVSITISPIKDKDGNVTGVSNIIRDITQQKQMQEKLIISEELYRNLFKYMRNGFAYCKMEYVDGKADDFTYILVNKAFPILTGLKDVEGKKFSEIIPGVKNPSPEVVEIYGRVALTGTSEIFETYLQPLDMWFSISVYSPKKEYFVAIFDVITEHKKSLAILSASENRYRRLFEAARDGILILDAETGMIVDVNPYLIEILGYSHKEFLGKSIWDVGSFKNIIANKDNFLELQQKQYIRYEDLPLETFDGQIVHVEYVSNVYLVDNQKVIQCNIRDISERYLAQEEIRILNESLEKKVTDRTAELINANKELEAFSYSVSHDLRAPLRAIDGFSQIILDDYGKMFDAEGNRLFKVIRSNVVLMDRLIYDLLAMSVSGRSEINFSEVDMAVQAKKVFKEIQHAAGQLNGIDFNVAQLPFALCDQNLIKQVWINLISNAIKFSRGTQKPEISISGRTTDGMNIYTIKDNGVGYNPKYAHKLFGVFQRLHLASEFEGTGIGLAIVQRIVHRHGGSVWSESKMNEGATFSFSIPVKKINIHKLEKDKLNELRPGYAEMKVSNQ